MHLHFFPFWVCDMHNALAPEHLAPQFKAQAQKYLFCYLLSSVGCSGSHQEQRAAMLGWIGALRRRPGPHSELQSAPRIKPRSFQALCCPFKTQDQASSPHWFHVRTIRRTQETTCMIWGWLCISAVTHVPGNQHRKYLRRGMWQIWTYIIETKNPWAINWLES